MAIGRVGGTTSRQLRNDLITKPDQQARWAARLAPILQQALADTGQ